MSKWTWKNWPASKSSTSRMNYVTRMVHIASSRTQMSTRKLGRDFRTENQPWEAEWEARPTKQSLNSLLKSKMLSFSSSLMIKSNWKKKMQPSQVKTQFSNNRCHTSKRHLPIQVSSKVIRISNQLQHLLKTHKMLWSDKRILIDWNLKFWTRWTTQSINALMKILTGSKESISSSSFKGLNLIIW